MVRAQDRKFIIADPNKCSGCGVCEYICSLANEKAFNPYKSRIRTMRANQLANVAVTCRHCEDPDCVAVCPRNALKQEENTCIIRVDEKACNGCGYCIAACPFGAINMHPDKKVVFTCNNCSETDEKEPQCVKWCPDQALSVVTPETLAQKLRQKAVKNIFHPEEIAQSKNP
jgi:Fe-S-cluster-containing hydrogenase component 2